MLLSMRLFFIFFINAPAPTEIYTLSLHDALPILPELLGPRRPLLVAHCPLLGEVTDPRLVGRLAFFDMVVVLSEQVRRSEEHTSELQSRLHLVCRLLLEKKKIKKN